MKINTNTIKKIFTRRNLFRKMAFALIAMVTTLSTGLVRLQAQAALPYTVTDLGTVTSLGGLNNQPGNQLALVYSLGEKVVVRNFKPNCRPEAEFTLPGNSQGVSINDSRVLVASNGFEMFGDPCVFLDEDLSFLLDLPFLQGAYSVEVKANNNSRFAVGVSDVMELNSGALQEVPTRWRFTNTPGNAFTVERLQTAFRPAPLNTLRLPGTALDINDNGRVVGTQNGVACIFRDNQDPQLFAGNIREARGISNNDFITGIGLFGTYAGPQTRGWVLHPNGPFLQMRIPNIPLPYPFPRNNFFSGCQTNKINNAGHAVGTLISLNGKFATIWDRFGGLRDLTAACGLTTGRLTEAVDINDQGDILSYGLVNGVVHGFLLRPTGAPLTFASSGLY